jgi:Flp pilus assembly protein TadG
VSRQARPAAATDTGAAAIEMGMLLTVMAVIAVFLYPVGGAVIEKIRLGRATGDAIRFATATPNTPAYGSSGRHPSVIDIKKEAVRAYEAQGGSGVSTDDVTVTPAAGPGSTVTVRIEKTVSLGPLGSFLSAVHATSSQSITLAVNATGREE